MPWPFPEYKKEQVNRAGKILARDFNVGDDLVQHIGAWEILTNWRSSHGYPMNTFQATLREKLQGIDKKAIVSQRLKRTPSIINKLKRFDSMKLARMQDIGGLRAVVSTLEQVRTLQHKYQNSRFTHELIKVDDYIEKPKSTGYRSLHLVYRNINAKRPEYNGLHIELQFRTQLQHAWATAVETVGTYLNQSLKSSVGSEDWLNFFALTSSAFAYIENCPLIPGYEHLTRDETFREVINQEKRLNVLRSLRAYSNITMHISRKRAEQGSYHLLILDAQKKSINVESFGRTRLGEAASKYALAEERIEQGEQLQAVLVRTSSIEALKKAYPNYFLDTGRFIQQLLRIIRQVEPL